MTAMNISNTRAESATRDLVEEVRMAHGELYCLPYGVLNLRVVHGTAWVTSQAEDHVLEAGDELKIPRQPHVVIVSAVCHKPLLLELRRS